MFTNCYRVVDIWQFSDVLSNLEIIPRLFYSSLTSLSMMYSKLHIDDWLFRYSTSIAAKKAIGKARWSSWCLNAIHCLVREEKQPDWPAMPFISKVTNFMAKPEVETVMCDRDRLPSPCHHWWQWTNSKHCCSFSSMVHHSYNNDMADTTILTTSSSKYWTSMICATDFRYWGHVVFWSSLMHRRYKSQYYSQPGGSHRLTKPYVLTHEYCLNQHAICNSKRYLTVPSADSVQLVVWKDLPQTVIGV